MKKTKAEVKRAAEEFSVIAGRAVNEDEVTAHLDSFDEVAATEDAKRAYRTEIWDKQSPINGVPAETVLANRTDIPEDGTVYLIYQNDQVLFFQPHIPEVDGIKKMTPTTAKQHSDKHLDDHVKHEVENRARAHVVGRLNIDPAQAEAARQKRIEDDAVEKRVREEVAKIAEEVRSNVRREEAERILSEARAR